MWLGEAGDGPIEPPSVEAAIVVFWECVTRAEDAGLPVGRQRSDQVERFAHGTGFPIRRVVGVLTTLRP
jgi:hypothetical protein